MITFLEKVKTKINDNIKPEQLLIIDNSNFHKTHKSFNPNKFHFKIVIKSKKLKNMRKIDAHKTIFTGTNEYMKSTQPRIYIRTDQQRENNGQKSTGSEIIVDGIIVDHGPRNRYHLDKNLAIRRKASPKSQQNPSPESMNDSI